MKLKDIFTEKTKRNSNFELLRIVSILLIIAHHFAVHSGIYYDASNIGFNSLFIKLLNYGGEMGVNCFVLISGYFLVKDERLDFRKIIQLWVKVFVYSVVLYAAFAAAGKLEFSWQGLVRSFFPILTNYWWFITTYFIVYLLHPFINMALRNINQKAYVVMLVIMFVLWSLIPTISKSLVITNIIPVFSGYEMEAVQFSRIVWFVFLYCLAGFVRLHVATKNLNFKPFLWVAVAVFVVLFIVSIAVFAGFKSNHYYNDMETLQMLIPAVLLLCACACAEPHNNKVINFIASSTLGVYLLHEHGPTTRPYIWKDLFHGSEFADKPILILYALGALAAVFVVCLAIDLAYTYSIELLLKKALETEKGNKLCDRLSVSVAQTAVVVEPAQSNEQPVENATEQTQNDKETTNN